MDKRRIEKQKIRSIIKLHQSGHSRYFISKTLEVSLPTIRKYINIYESINNEKQIRLIPKLSTLCYNILTNRISKLETKNKKMKNRLNEIYIHHKKTSIFNILFDRKRIGDLCNTHKSLHFIKGRNLYVDASAYIVSSTTAPYNLTDKNGNGTSHLVATFNLVLQFKKLQINQVWVFDPILLNRKKIKYKYRNKEKNTHEEDEVKLLLKYMGIDYVVSPTNVEADKICALLSGENGYCYSSDGDIILFKGNLIRKCKKHYKSYKINEILKIYSLDYEDFVIACLLCGTDFNFGTKGITVRTAIDKVKNNDFVLNHTQKKTFDYITSKIQIPSTIFNKLDTLKLYKYLESKDFNSNKIVNSIKLLK